MDYFDDILNVYAYLFSKEKKASKKLRENIEKVNELNASYTELDEQCQSLAADLDEDLKKAYKLAYEMGIDTSDVKKTVEKEKKEKKGTTEPGILLTPDFDFKKDFERLVEEAHAAGFTNVCPEDVLSEEEIDRAKEFSEKLDEEFAAATKLKNKDIVVLSIAVAIRVCWYYFVRLLDANSLSDELLTVTESTESEKLKNTVKPTGTGGGLLSEPGKGPKENIDATKGVDVGKLLKNAGVYGDAVKTGKKIAEKVTKRSYTPAKIRDCDTIMIQNVPFDVQDTDLFKKEDVIAYNKFLGWIIGVVNIMTDTVTTYNMNSYSINRTPFEATKPFVEKKISTLSGVLMPVVKNGSLYKESVIAAVLQEAIVLDYGKASPENIREMFTRAVETERRTAALAEKTNGVLGFFNAGLGAAVSDVAVIALLNTVISAIHSILYDETDGDIAQYTIRTNKIILYSGMIATSINSIPAFVTEDISKLDLAGVITGCISLFQSTRFWIDVKADFLVKAHSKELEAELEKINKYFENQ